MTIISVWELQTSYIAADKPAYNILHWNFCIAICFLIPLIIPRKASTVLCRTSADFLSCSDNKWSNENITPDESDLHSSSVISSFTWHRFNTVRVKRRDSNRIIALPNNMHSHEMVDVLLRCIHVYMKELLLAMQLATQTHTHTHTNAVYVRWRKVQPSLWLMEHFHFHRGQTVAPGYESPATVYAWQSLTSCVCLLILAVLTTRKHTASIYEHTNEVVVAWMPRSQDCRTKVMGLSGLTFKAVRNLTPPTINTASLVTN